MKGFKIQRAFVVAQNGRPHDIVETLRRKFTEVGRENELRIGKVPLSPCLGELRRKDCRRYLILATKHRGKVRRPQPTAGAYFKNRFARQNVKTVTHGDR